MKPSWYFSTHCGNVRERNEDAFFLPEAVDPDLLEVNGYLLAVADGMGGHAGGQIASNIAVSALSEFYRHRFDLTEEKGWSEWASNRLKDLIFRINHYIFGAHYASNDLPSEMGTTLVGILIKGEEALAFCVGDSRLYHLSATRGFYQVSKDHSKVQILIDQGLITKEGARSHPDANVVTRSLGTNPDRGKIAPDLFPLSLQAGDQILICSDGLSDLVEERLISQSMLLGGTDLPETAASLVDEALKKGGFDNITLGVVQMRPSSRDSDEELLQSAVEAEVDSSEHPEKGHPEEPDYGQNLG